MSPRPQLARLVVTLAQLSMLALVVSTLGIEEGAGLPAIVGWVVAGWVVHALAPPAWQPTVFVATSVAVIVAKLGWEAPWLLLPGLLLAEVTHLRASLRVRAGLMALAAVLLGVLRAGVVETPWPTLALATLGSMFMFRAVLALADPGGPEVDRVTRWGYFFQWPNALFLLYPIVDWGAWRRPPSVPVEELHQRGIRWVARGVMHLVLYRLVYHLAVPADWRITDASAVLWWIFAGYGLYLRISGQFHLIVGFLLLFGRDLPETHHHYFLASSFNDYWRRINIYWKDFVEKIVFFPLFLRLRRAGVPQPLVVSVLATFAATWVLHSWQWFWLRGQPLVTVVDTLFWALLGLAVAANSWWESTRPRRRGKARLAHLRHALATAATFLVLSALWSFWGSESIETWADRMALLADGSPAPLVVLLLLAVAVAVGTFWMHLRERPEVAGRLRALAADRSGWGTLGSCATLVGIAVAVGLPPTGSERLEQVRAAVASEHLNEQDYLARTRGYYEDLRPKGGVLGEAWHPDRGFPPGWVKLTDSEFSRKEDGSLMYELAPGTSGFFHGAPIAINAHGMRDREYALEKPPGTFRIALLGASIEMGGGVEHEDVFEQVVEDRLNRELGQPLGIRFEVLNFAVDGYTLLHHVVVYETKVRPFRPDLVIHAAHRGDGERIVRRVARLARMSRPIPNPRLAELAAQHDLGSLTEDEGTKRLAPYEREATELLYRQLADAVRRDGARVAWLLVPQVRDLAARPPAEDWQRALAVAAGMIPLSAEGAYGRRTAPEIQQAPWDDHPNTLGHRLIADRVYAELVLAAPQLGLRQSPK